MGLIFTPPLSIQDAKRLGYDIYEVLFSNWGVTNAPPSTQFGDMQFPLPGQPGIPASVAGIAIGPRSTVDRCWISYDPLKKRNPQDPNQPNGLLRMLSLDSPLMFTQSAGPPGAKNTPGAANDPALTLSDKGAFYVFPMANNPGPAISFSFPAQQETTVLPPSYKDVNGVVRTFGNVGDFPTYMSPFLHLYLYLKVPSIPFIPTKRAPLQVQGQVLIPANEQGIEKIVAQIPTFGRKSIKVMMIAGSAADFRVGALRAIGQVVGMQEQPVDEATGIAGATPTVLSPCHESNHYADYTNLYATPTTNNVTVVSFQFTAYD